ERKRPTEILETSPTTLTRKIGTSLAQKTRERYTWQRHSTTRGMGANDLEKPGNEKEICALTNAITGQRR
ncbi:MAG: hypothetical protein ACXWP1_12830, partial [Bdellovibrionota bacterium]